MAAGAGRFVGVIAKGYGVSFSGDENVLKLIVLIVAQLCKYTENHLNGELWGP